MCYCILLLRCYIVFTVPPSIVYNDRFADLILIYERVYFLPLFNVKNRDRTLNKDQVGLMERIARKRISDSIIPSDVLRSCVLYSGGLVNDFLRMLRQSCFKALSLLENNEVNNNVLDEIFMDLVHDYRSRIEAKYYPNLVKVHKEKEIEVDGDHIHLLSSQAILEYRENNGTRWYDIHPAVKQILMDRKLIEKGL